MNTDAIDNSEFVKLNIKLPKQLLEERDERADELNYTNHSELIVS